MAGLVYLGNILGPRGNRGGRLYATTVSIWDTETLGRYTMPGTSDDPMTGDYLVNSNLWLDPEDTAEPVIYVGAPDPAEPGNPDPPDAKWLLHPGQAFQLIEVTSDLHYGVDWQRPIYLQSRGGDGWRGGTTQVNQYQWGTIAGDIEDQEDLIDFIEDELIESDDPFDGL